MGSRPRKLIVKLLSVAHFKSPEPSENMSQLRIHTSPSSRISPESVQDDKIMTSQMFDRFSDHRFQLIATAILSGAAAASLLLGYQSLQREERLSQLKNSIPSLTEDHDVQKVSTSS